MTRFVLFSLLSLCVARCWGFYFNCTSGCQVYSSNFNDTNCDCDDCSDEPDYECDTCKDGCPSSEECQGSGFYYYSCPGFICTSGCIIDEWDVDDSFCDCDDCSDESEYTCSSCGGGCPSSNECNDGTWYYCGGGGNGNGNGNTDSTALGYDWTYANCSDIWDKSSTATCEVDADYINDNECDCPSCEDEKYYTCETCGNGCPADSTYCSYWTECDGSYTVDLDLSCNFGIPDDFGVPVVEGTCFSLDYDFSAAEGTEYAWIVNDSFTRSGIVNCNDNGTATVTYYPNSATCEDVAGTYTAPVPLYSCGGNTVNCDTHTIWYDLFLGNDTDSCSSKQRIRLGAVYANLANLNCADDIKYDVTEDDGIVIGYYYNGDLDGTCSGDVGYENSLSTLGCNKVSYFSQYLTVEAGIQQEPGEDSPYIKEVSGAGRTVSVFGVVVLVVSLYFV